MPKKKQLAKEENNSSTDAPSSAEATEDKQDKKEETLSGPSPISINVGSAAPPDGVSKSDTLQDLIEKNIKWSQVIYEQNRRIKRRLAWMVFGSYLRLFLILAPIILGIIYLPELIDTFFGDYSALLKATGGLDSDVLEQAVKLLGN